MYPTGRMNLNAFAATRKKYHGTNLIHRYSSNAITTDIISWITHLARFRGLTPGPPLLSQIPPQLSKTVARL